MYRLNPDVEYDDYAKWSKEVDQPITPSQVSVHSFEVFQIQEPIKAILLLTLLKRSWLTRGMGGLQLTPVQG